MPSSLKPVGRPVTHCTCGKLRKTVPTTNREPVCSMSVALIHPISSPEERPKPLLMASYMPRSGSLIHECSCVSYRRRISMLPSVDRPSTTMYSRFGYPWLSTDRNVASRYRTELNTGVTRLIFGHDLGGGARGSAAIIELDAGRSTGLLVSQQRNQRGVLQLRAGRHEDAAKIMPMARAIEVVAPLEAEVFVLRRYHGRVNKREADAIQSQHHVVRRRTTRNPAHRLVHVGAFILHTNQRLLVIADDRFKK